MVNANFNAVAAATNNINSANIGALGIYASQLIPTTGAQATFGGTIGYTFLAPAIGVTPLTIQLASGQTADGLDVLLFGGAKAFAVTATGVTYATSLAALSVPAIPSAALLPGDMVAQFSASGGQICFGGATKAGEIAFNSNVSNGFEFKDSVSSTFTAFSAGTYTNASDERIKSNIEDLPHGLDALRSLRARQFTMTADDTNALHFGFTAQQVRTVLPDLVTEDNNGDLGIKQPHLLAVAIKSIQDLDAEFSEYKAAHP